jgi:hypothetical protein
VVATSVVECCAAALNKHLSKRLEVMEWNLLKPKENQCGFVTLKKFMKKLILSTIIGGSLAGLTLAANAGVVVVPGTSDPWLSGQPNGTTASSEDVAPAQSPVYAGSVTPGGTVTWTATGLVGNGPLEPQFGPNGDVTGSRYGLFSHGSGAENGISDVLGIGVDSLMGVFLGPGVPSGAAPAPLNFSSIGFTYTSLSPLVDQVFYMGDGSAQSLIVPTGATRLYLGTMDGFGWDNNLGSFTVDLTQGVTGAVPDAGSTLTMLGIAFGLVGLVRRKTS